IRTADDDYVEKRLGIPLSQAPLITFGSDTMLCHPDSEQRQRFRAENNISQDAFVVLYAGKLDEFKGGKFLAELTCQKMQTKRELVFVVVGNTVGDYGAEVEARFAESPYRVLRFPTQKYCDLASFFQVADLALIPKQCSLSLYDMGACGLPVLAENNNINVERCSHENGWTFEKDNVEDFSRKLTEIANMDQTELDKVSKAAAEYILENYDYAKKAREYEQEIINTVNRRKS
ncbi:MAG: glycosyltransferase family 4 protein, partial [Clostridia bacterium]|nr:glycosyltransferase family 4 protein [Clostridia bacterium]